MFERILKNTNSYFDESYPKYNTSTKSKDLIQNTSPLFNNSPTSPCNWVTESTDI